MRWSNDCHLPTLIIASSKPRPWLLQLFFICVSVCTLRVGASASVKGAASTCGTAFTDPQSSTLLADVVLEGRVREKVLPKQGPWVGSGRFNMSVQVRKQVWKGKELLNGGRKARKLLLGTFVSSGDIHASMKLPVDSANAGAGGDGSLVNCVGDVKEGATYIFFLKQVGDKRGKYFHISALPIKKSRRLSRAISKSIKAGAQKPVIQRLKGPRRVNTGSAMTLRCKAKARPPAIYTWFHNGTELQSKRGMRIKNSKRGSRLKIIGANEDSAGQYTCRVTNAVGETSKSLSVRVKVVKQIHVPCKKQTFCFNGGTCRYLPDLQQAFCQCPRKWAGQRCELLDPFSIGMDQDNLHREASMWYERTLIVVGIVIAALVLVVICIASYFLAKRRRKTFETRKRMKQNMGTEKDRLLNKADGTPSIHHIPSYRPQHTKQTQTDDLQPSNVPVYCDSVSNSIHAKPNHPDTFHMDRHFPVISNADSPNTASPPARNGLSHRPTRPASGMEGRGLERRESRSRLKAVSVDDSCRDRPPSWKAECDDPNSQAVPLIEHSDKDHPELIEMSDFNARPNNVTNNHEINSLPEFLSTFNSPELMAVPIKMEKQPRDNAHAQLKSPTENTVPVLPVTMDSDSSPREETMQPMCSRGMDGLDPGQEPMLVNSNPEISNQSKMLPVNGSVEGLTGESEEDLAKLAPLYISEEDLNGNLSKADTLESGRSPIPYSRCHSTERTNSATVSPCPPVSLAVYRPKDLPTVRVDDAYMPTIEPLPRNAPEKDSAEILPCTVSSAEASSPLTEYTPQGDLYVFDPAMDSDPNDFDEQFMHGSPRKSAGGFSEAEIQTDYERRLRNVRSDQEAIHI